MCKILLTCGIKPEKSKLLEQFIYKVAPILGRDDEDGMGYVALSKNGEMFGERWLNNTMAFNSSLKESTEQKIAKMFFGALIEGRFYNKFGKVQRDKITSVCLHARKATTDVSLDNTHPFVSENGKTALIHNGIVDILNLKLKTSTCDSEGLLNLYTKLKMYDHPKQMKKFAKMVDGYYACGIITQDSIGKWYMDIIKDNRAQLYAVYIKELDNVVFCTNETIILETCKLLGWTASGMFFVQDNTFIRLNALTGKVLSTRKFKKEEFVRYVRPLRKKKKKDNWDVLDTSSSVHYPDPSASTSNDTPSNPDNDSPSSNYDTGDGGFGAGSPL